MDLRNDTSHEIANVGMIINVFNEIPKPLESYHFQNGIMNEGDGSD